MSTQSPEIKALRSLGEAQHVDEFVDFWPAGTTVQGVFACVACGRQVFSAYQLPPCPSCDGRLWEDPESSPFATAPFATHLSAYEQWNADEINRTANFVRGAFAAMLAGAVLWLFLGVSAYVLFGVAHP
jgi:hypothetical protein